MVDGVAKGRLGNAAWFTNLDHAERREELIPWRRYTPEEYPTYDNYCTINVNRTAEIPMDYDGAMGVPITFLDKHRPEQFELLNADDLRADSTVPVKLHGLIKDKDNAVDGKPTYARIVIRRTEFDA